MVVGFSSTTFTTTETTGYANVCVSVTNLPSGGAIRPFTVTILPGEGIVTINDWQEECSHNYVYSTVGHSKTSHNTVTNSV